MLDATPNHPHQAGQQRPVDHTGHAVQGQPHAGGTERPMREFHKSRGDRMGNAVVSVLARAGIGPFWLLTTRGRKTGRT